MLVLCSSWGRGLQMVLVVDGGSVQNILSKQSVGHCYLCCCRSVRQLQRRQSYNLQRAEVKRSVLKMDSVYCSHSRPHVSPLWRGQNSSSSQAEMRHSAIKGFLHPLKCCWRFSPDHSLFSPLCIFEVGHVVQETSVLFQHRLMPYR